MAKEFIKVFPGRCIICAFHDYAIREGMIHPKEKIQKHCCIEGNPPQQLPIQ